MYKKTLLIIVSLGLKVTGMAQLCTFPGQTPISAILVCGSESFTVNTPTFCGQTVVPVPCYDGFQYQNTNPNFFRMSCFSAGTLGFIIIPNDPLADFNWQLFDITNTNPSDIFLVPSLFTACNWSAEPGETGASVTGENTSVCYGIGNLPYSKMPAIQQGHTYLLMICNQSNSQDGYQLTFTGGSASITDPLLPQLKTVRTNCDGTQLIVRTNKRIQCGSIAADGSDFTLSNGAFITSAAAGNCSSSQGTDSVILSLNQPLSNGNYSLMMSNGTDGNTLLDFCGQFMAETESLPFTVSSLQPTALDSIRSSGCSPSFIELVFQKPIRCNSIAVNGSDFIITGPQTVTAVFVPGTCNIAATTSVIRLNLLSPITVGGIYQVQLTTGTDGNTILDECGIASVGSSVIQFNVSDDVSALFTYSMPIPCDNSIVSLFHNGNNVSIWNWSFGNGISSSSQSPVHTFSLPGSKTIRLIVSNGNCTDTASQTLIINEKITATFKAPQSICPGDAVHLINTSSGSNSWQWNFGNNTFSNQQTPASYKYNYTGRETLYTVRLIALNTISNCADTAIQIIRELSKCTVAVPTAFTPNSDGKNDYLGALHAGQVRNFEFKVYNRYGQLVFVSKDPAIKWDGKINGLLQDTGIFAWLLSFIHPDSGKPVIMKGTTLLIR